MKDDILVATYSIDKNAYFASDPLLLLHNLPGTYLSTCHTQETKQFSRYFHKKARFIKWLNLSLNWYAEVDLSEYRKTGWKIKLKNGDKLHAQAMLSRENMNTPCRRLLPEIDILTWMSQFDDASIKTVAEEMPSIIGETYMIIVYD